MKGESSPPEIWRFECRLGMPGHFTVWVGFCKALNPYVCGVMEQAKRWKDGLKAAATKAKACGSTQLFLEEGVYAGLGDGFVNFGFSAAGGNAAEGLAVYLDGEATLVGEKVRKRKGFNATFFHGIGGVF